MVIFLIPSPVNEQPIGIFDSGVGGLTVANAIKQILPGESLVYFGDTAHLPYGDKSAEAIRYYSGKITEFLLGHNAKVILVACNSASASAFDSLREEFSDRVHLIDVIDPVVDYLSSKNFRKIGVIGTKRTISSGAYDSKIRERTNGLVIGVERNGKRILNPDSETVFEWGDIVLIAGERGKIQSVNNPQKSNES